MTERCDGRYLVGHPRSEPFDVTYRCGLHKGHQGECSPGRCGSVNEIMIQWSLTLTGNQIALLRAYRNRKFGVPFDADFAGKGYIVGTRTLCREGLVEHRATLHAPTDHDPS